MKNDASRRYVIMANICVQNIGAPHSINKTLMVIQKQTGPDIIIEGDISIILSLIGRSMSLKINK